MCFHPEVAFLKILINSLLIQSQAQWHTPLITALERCKGRQISTNSSLIYTASSRPAKATKKLFLNHSEDRSQLVEYLPNILKVLVQSQVSN